MADWTKKSKLGAHVTTGQRNGYGKWAGKMNNVVTFDQGAFDEVPADAVKIFRSHNESNHKDAPGDFDQLKFSDLQEAAKYWFNRMQPIFADVKRKFPEVYIQFTNEINSPAPDFSKGETQPRILEYTQGLIDIAHEQGFKLAILGDAGGSPDLALWKQYWLPFLVKNKDKDIIYNRHVYTKLTSDQGLYLTKETVSLQAAHEFSERPFIEARLLRDAGCLIPILISELGWKSGWNKLPQKWLADIMRYNQIMLQHDNIIGGSLWTYGKWETAPIIFGDTESDTMRDALEEYEPQFYDFSKEPVVEPVVEPPVVEPVITPPVVTPEQDTDFLEFIVTEMREAQTQSLNSQAALQKYILAQGWLPLGNEGRITIDMQVYATQGAASLKTGNEYAIYALEGEWDLVAHMLITPDIEGTDSIAGQLALSIRDNQTQSLNMEAALQKAIIEDGLLPISNEVWVTHQSTGRHVAIQGAANLETGVEYVYFSDVNQWEAVYVHSIVEIPETSSGDRPDVFTSDGKVEMIDVSRYQGEFDYGRLPEHVIGVIAKSTEGTSYNDPLFKRNHDESKKKGLIFGAYHFFRPGENPTLQAQNLALSIQGLDHVHLIVVDVEKRLITDNDEFYDDQLQAFIETVTAMTDMKPFIYTGFSLWIELTTNPQWAKQYPLWIAHYYVDTPLVPGPWGPKEWILHQYTSTNRSYIGSNLDVNTSKLTRYPFMDLCKSLVTDSGLKLVLNEPAQESVPDVAPVVVTPVVVAPVANTVDLRPYIVPAGNDSRNYIVQTVSGPHKGASEVFRTWVSNVKLFIDKNNLRETYMVGSQYLYSDSDTSPGADSQGNPRYYLVRQAAGTHQLVPRFPFDMEIGKQWVGQPHWVQFFHKETGQKLTENSGWATNEATLQLVGKWNHPVTGKFFEDVAVIQTGQETQVFARGIGLICWVSPWGASQYADDQGNIRDQPSKDVWAVASPQW